jgi:DNA-binding CsgD family transcriptional regulator
MRHRFSEPPRGSGEAGVDRFLLDLYGANFGRGDRSFPEMAFGQLEAMIPFDAAFWSRASVGEEGVRLHAAYLYKLAPALIDAWGRYQDRDVVGPVAMAQLGRSVSVDTLEVVSDPDVRRDVIHAFDLGQMLTICLLDAATQLINSLTLARGVGAERFSEPQRLLMDRLAPHLVQAYATDRLLRLYDAPAEGPLAYAAALADRDGVLHFAAPEFVELVRSQWRSWRAPQLPAPLAGAQGWRKRVFSRIVVRASSAGDFVRLHARPRGDMEELTEREAEIARLAAGGSSTKAIATGLGLSPFTVRNHLNRIFGKLGVASRSALGAFSAELD